MLTLVVIGEACSLIYNFSDVFLRCEEMIAWRAVKAYGFLWKISTDKAIDLGMFNKNWHSERNLEIIFRKFRTAVPSIKAKKNFEIKKEIHSPFSIHMIRHRHESTGARISVRKLLLM